MTNNHTTPTPPIYMNEITAFSAEIKGLLQRHLDHEIGVPEGSGYYAELTQFLDGCPPEYWRDWISDKASQLEATHINNKKSMVSEFLSQHLDSHKGESKQ